MTASPETSGSAKTWRQSTRGFICWRADPAAAELREQLRALLAHVDAGESDGASEPPDSPGELLVLWLSHYQRSVNTRAAYARELLLFLGRQPPFATTTGW